MTFLTQLFYVLVSCQICNCFEDGNSYIRSFLELSKIYPPDPSETSMPPSCGKTVNDCDCSEKYYRLDGSCNNLDNPEWGLPNSTYSRLLPPAYSDGIYTPRKACNGSPLPGARRVRVTVFPGGSKLDKDMSLVTMQWGQVITHDMSLQRSGPGGRCCTTDAKIQDKLSKFCFPIKISPGDAVLGSTMACMNFTRSMADKDLGCSPSSDSPAKQINVVTSWLDLSIVYDIDTKRNMRLRTGVDGLMRTIKREGNIYPPQNPKAEIFCDCNEPGEKICYEGGDARMNQSPHLLLLQIILLREHNRLARELKKINPQWNDETLFHEARRINIAQCQYISYYEWMPVVFGLSNLIENEIIFPDAKCHIDDYDTNISPEVSNEHAHAAFRRFHSQITEMLRLMDNNRKIKSSINIADFLHRPGVIEQTKTSFADLARGLLSQPLEDNDEINIPVINDHMFGCKGARFGIDLRSFDIQRDRDHGNRNYNDYRKICGIPEANCFEDFEDHISKSNIKKLKKIYQNPCDVDLSVGGGLEKKYKGSQVGPTFLCIILEQFKRTRQADRLWFEHKQAGFSEDQLAELRKSSLSRIFCDNEKGITKIQRNAFLTVKKPAQDLVPCSSISVVDLKKWKSY